MSFENIVPDSPGSSSVPKNLGSARSATRTLGSLEPILKEVYYVGFTNQLKEMARQKAAWQGWKRDRESRIKWHWKMLLK